MRIYEKNNCLNIIIFSHGQEKNRDHMVLFCDSHSKNCDQKAGMISSKWDIFSHSQHENRG